MGWASGGEVFDAVASALRRAEATPQVKQLALAPLIDQLRDQDWDTMDESLEEFRDDPVIVELFRARGVTLDDIEEQRNAGLASLELIAEFGWREDYAWRLDQDTVRGADSFALLTKDQRQYWIDRAREFLSEKYGC